MSSERASFVKLQGHRDAVEFAQLIGLKADYSNDLQAKKDVIDLSGDSYSVKSGEKKWQIFLYGRRRFEDDYAFQAMNGIGQLLLNCINSFPDHFNEYKENKMIYKEKLKEPMTELKNRLQEKRRLAAFINKAMFNGGEVNYLSIKDGSKFHVFSSVDVVRILAENLTVENSYAKTEKQVDRQKVIFKKQKTFGEIEMRNDSEKHYRQVKFWFDKKLVTNLLIDFFENEDKRKFGDNIVVYGRAIKKFGKWIKNK